MKAAAVVLLAIIALMQGCAFVSLNSISHSMKRLVFSQWEYRSAVYSQEEAGSKTNDAGRAGFEIVSVRPMANGKFEVIYKRRSLD